MELIPQIADIMTSVVAPLSAADTFSQLLTAFLITMISWEIKIFMWLLVFITEMIFIMNMVRYVILYDAVWFLDKPYSSFYFIWGGRVWKNS